MKKSKAGRPTVLTEEVVRKFEEAFKNDFTDTEACLYAQISRETYYFHKSKNKIFSDKMDTAKQFPFFLAKKNIMQAIQKGMVEDSWKFLSKRQKELYSDRLEQTGANGTPLIPANELPDDDEYTEFLNSKRNPTSI